MTKATEIWNAEFKIESNIPVPASRFRVGPTYPWQRMQPGDSFLVQWPDDLTQKQRESMRTSISGSARNANMKCVTRNTPEGLRVWRME